MVAIDVYIISNALGREGMDFIVWITTSLEQDWEVNN